jgi:O-antigen ligase
VTVGPKHSAPLQLELLVAAHLTLFVVGVSWAFGGNADWVRTPISLWGSLGILLTVALLLNPETRKRFIGVVTPWVLPVLLLNLLVAASCLTPGFRNVTFGGTSLMMPMRVDWWVPSSARPETSIRSVWLFDGIYFSCLNLALAVRRKRTIRFILAAAVTNSFVLAAFGTAQKLAGSTGIFFGAVKSPQSAFFASFVYDNHWGAFTILMLGACMGLILRYAHGIRGEGFFRGPALTGLVAVALIAASIPLSGSRACSLLLLVLTSVALIQGTPRIARELRHSGITPGGTLLAIALAAALAAGSVWFVAGDVIQARASKTKEQLGEIWAQGGIGSRSVLYGDTWRMARVRPLFGWGMGTFPTVFLLFNTQESKIDHIPVVYHDAHSDWIQSVAEIGFVGTALIGLAVLLPARTFRASRLTAIPFFLVTALLLVAGYAWVEFPFGNVAVVLSWWFCFFCAIQYVRLTENTEEPVGEP